MNAAIRTFRDLFVYKNAMALAMEVFTVTQKFPTIERYSLIDQIRRSSRSVCANLAEAWRKRRYKAAFIAKLSDAESEASETQVWIEIANRCHYIDDRLTSELDDRCDHIIAQLVRVIDHPEKWIIPTQ